MEFVLLRRFDTRSLTDTSYCLDEINSDDSLIINFTD